MAATKFNLFNLRNTVKKEKHHKRKSKRNSRENVQNVDRSFSPFVTTNEPKTDINSFWTYSPRNPFCGWGLGKLDPSRHAAINKSTISKPKLPSNSAARKMSSILSRRESDNTAAVIEARREIEKIKTELETMIKANIKTQSFYAESASLIPPEIESLLDTAEDVCNNLANTPKPSEAEAPPKTKPKPVIKSNATSPAPSVNRKKPATPVPAEETVPLEPIRSKLRTYDPEKTREFIKKQKQRRKQKLLEEEQKKQQKEFARKNKLDELKKKTLELVAKNLKGPNSKRAKSPSTVNVNNTPKSNAQTLDNNKTANMFLLQSRRCRARSFDLVNRDKESDNNKRSRSVSREITTATSKHFGQQQQQQQPPQQQQKPENQYQSIGTKSQVTLQSSSQKSLSTTPKSIATTKKPSQKTIHETSIGTKENNPKSDTHNQQNETFNEPKPPETNAAKELSEIKQKLETSITQIKDKNELQVWLQPPSSVPYPYNFISAVRKKLEYVTRKQPPNNQDKTEENNKLNVSIQCSIDKKILDVNSVNIPKLESPKNNRTYESHKCRRQLYVSRKDPTDFIKPKEIEINIKKSDSDSDTTKNIPEIPHENTLEENKRLSSTSNTSERLKNITFERNIPPKLNIGDIKLPEPVKYAALIPPDDKLSKHSKQSSSSSRKSRSKYPDDIDSILSHYSKIKSEHNSYSDDFNSTSSKPEEKSESVTEYKQIPISLSKSGSISEHLPQTHSNSSSKENIFEGQEKNSNSVSTETNPTMKDVPSLSSKQSDSNQIKTDIQTINNKSEENVKKLTKPEVFLKRRAEEIENNPNHIHLKLQAEVHLLNSFNNSLKQVVAVEKSVFDVPSTSNTNFNPINCTRGCDFTEKPVAFTNGLLQNGGPTNFKNISDYDSIYSQDLLDKSSIASHSTTIASNSIISRREENLDFKSHPYVAISLDMVDQMIKDEDVRLEHLKAVLKLRDQALFDRIKGELALLEIRKRELREHGLTNDITAIKKKQRGLIIKLQQERHEMHRLKTAHKQAAKARKTALHEQKSIIKTQLSSTDQIPKKLRRLSHLERPSLGPVKVYRVDSKTEVSETTLSRKGSDDSVTNSSVLTQISEKISVEKSEIYYSDSLAVEPVKPAKQHSLQSEKLKRSLLMKEAEIDKRRKEIEELIKWQKRLKQKEAEVVELERKAVKSLQSDDPENVRVFSGAHLNKVWKGIALPDKNFDEQKKYQMSKRSLDKFYQNARKMFKEVSEEEKRSKTESYSSEFEQSNSVASLNDVEVQTKMVAERLRHISDIISVPDDDRTLIKEHAKSTSSEDISSIQEDNKSVSVSYSESPSVKTEVNTLAKSDSIHSEFIDSLHNKSPSKSLELIIASEYSSQKPEQSNSIVSESLKTDSLEVIKTGAEISESAKSDVSSASEDKSHSRSIISEISDSLNSKVSEPQVCSVFEASAKSESQILENVVSEISEPQVVENIISDISSAAQSDSEASEPQVSEKIVSEKSNSIPKSISEATEKSDSQIVEKIVSEQSTPKTESEASEPHVLENMVSEKSDSIPKSISEATKESDSQIVEKIISQKSTPKTESEASEPQVLENIVSEKSSVISISEATDESDSQIKERSISEKSTPKTYSEASALQELENIISEKSSVKSDSVPKSIPEATEESDSQIVEKIVSEKSSPNADSETSEPQVLENIISEKSSVKSDSVPKSITGATGESDSQIVEKNISEKSTQKTYSEASEPQVLENIISEKSSVKSDSVPKSIPEITEESYSQIVEKIVSEKSSPKTDSEALEQSEPQVLENIISEKSEINTHDIKSISEKSELEITENVASLNSSTKSEINTSVAEKCELQIPENTDSHNSQISEKSQQQEFEESPEISTTQPQESRISSEESTWEPQIISEIIKSDSSEKQINSEPETKTKTNSETHISEENVQTDRTTPRSEVQYETDFDKLSESDQSNGSLKETNVDSSINEDESIKSIKEEENTIKEKSDSANEEISDEDLSDSKKGVSHIDVRKRVSEILADANANGQRGDKSPRVQDLYTTTYDIAGSSESTPESGSPTNEFNKPEKTASLSPETPYINEAEELLRKQLEIEQEIKRLERQQQNIPYLFMREIPNKPPPPYKPPDFPLTPVIASIIPSKPEQTKKLINETTAILFGAYSTGELANTSSKTKDDQQRFMFDLCKEIALEACKPAIETKVPAWKTQKNKFQNLFAKRPITKDYLNSVLNRKVLQLLNFEPVTRNDSLIIRWSRKKRDHVDEILVSETQAEEAEWTNFDSDEEVIKENLTQHILDVLIVDAAKDMDNICKKKRSFSWVDC